MKGLALGCSHTAGVGVLATECYISLLSMHYNCNIINTALPGGNAENCLKQLVAQLREETTDFIIAQWPNPIRRTLWINNKPQYETIQSSSTTFHLLLKSGIDNFIQPWLQCIITADTLCKFAGIKIVHIMLEDLDSEYVDVLHNNDITLHRDLKKPGQTWLFDSAGSDNLHHSPRCHAQWAERLIGLLNEHTT
jgi:hypothetical protein